MIGIKKQTEWYNSRAEQLQHKNAEMIMPGIIQTVSEFMYVAALLEAAIMQQNLILKELTKPNHPYQHYE